MRKQYIIPSTTSFSFRTDYICQTAVNSVHGPLNYGGDIEDPGTGI